MAQGGCPCLHLLLLTSPPTSAAVTGCRSTTRPPYVVRCEACSGDVQSSPSNTMNIGDGQLPSPIPLPSADAATNRRSATDSPRVARCTNSGDEHTSSVTTVRRETPRCRNSICRLFTPTSYFLIRILLLDPLY